MFGERDEIELVLSYNAVRYEKGSEEELFNFLVEAKKYLENRLSYRITISVLNGTGGFAASTY